MVPAPSHLATPCPTPPCVHPVARAAGQPWHQHRKRACAPPPAHPPRTASYVHYAGMFEGLEGIDISPLPRGRSDPLYVVTATKATDAAAGKHNCAL